MGAMQALIPLGIITAALGVGGNLLGWLPVLFHGEVRTARQTSEPGARGRPGMCRRARALHTVPAHFLLRPRVCCATPAGSPPRVALFFWLPAHAASALCPHKLCRCIVAAQATHPRRVGVCHVATGRGDKEGVLDLSAASRATRPCSPTSLRSMLPRPGHEGASCAARPGLFVSGEVVVRGAAARAADRAHAPWARGGSRRDGGFETLGPPTHTGGLPS